MFPVQMPRVRVPCTLNSELTGSHTVSDYNMVWPYDRAYELSGTTNEASINPAGATSTRGGSL